MILIPESVLKKSPVSEYLININITKNKLYSKIIETFPFGKKRCIKNQYKLS